MFDSVEAAIAALALGNIRFKCNVCGKSHLLNKDGWRRCHKKNITGTLFLKTHTRFTKYTIIDADRTHIRLPYITVRKPAVYNWTVPMYLEDLNTLDDCLKMLNEIYKTFIHLFAIMPPIGVSTIQISTLSTITYDNKTIKYDDIEKNN